MRKGEVEATAEETARAGLGPTHQGGAAATYSVIPAASSRVITIGRGRQGNALATVDAELHP